VTRYKISTPALGIGRHGCVTGPFWVSVLCILNLFRIRWHLLRRVVLRISDLTNGTLRNPPVDERCGQKPTVTDSKILQKTACIGDNGPYNYLVVSRSLLGRTEIRHTNDAIRVCGCSSVVERHVANVNVVSSNLITRSWEYSQGRGPTNARFSVWGTHHSVGELPANG
jgi:hypothetical protein